MKKIFLLVVTLITLSGCATSYRLLLRARYKIVRIPTVGMQPTIKVGDYAAVDINYYSKNPVQRFDMIVLHNPQPNAASEGPDTYVLKRVIGLGGERVEIRDGKVLINDKELKQPFQTVSDDSRVSYQPWLIPRGEYFLMGDNRPNSFDSRHWKKPTIDRNAIYGKVVEVVSGDK